MPITNGADELHRITYPVMSQWLADFQERSAGHRYSAADRSLSLRLNTPTDTRTVNTEYPQTKGIHDDGQCSLAHHTPRLESPGGALSQNSRRASSPVVRR